MMDVLEPCHCDTGYCWGTTYPDGGKSNRRCVHDDYRDIIESQTAALRELAAERDKLQLHIAQLTDEGDDKTDEIVDLEAERDALRSEVERLREALRSVVRDCENCDWRCYTCGVYQGMAETDLYHTAKAALQEQGDE